MRIGVANKTTARRSAEYREGPYWWDGTDFPDPGEAALPAEVDVAVVGAGYTGLGAALELAKLGRSVAVLERHRTVWGASSRNGGMVLTGGKHSIDEILAARDGRELWDVTVAAVEGVHQLVMELNIECGWERSGHLELAHHPRVVAAQRKAAAAYESIGEEAHLLAADELASEIGTRKYYGGLLVNRSGALHPGRFAAGLARAALAAGAIVHEGTDVTAVEREGAGFVVRTGRGSLRAGEVVIATNGYTDGLVPWLYRRILPVGSYIIATEPLPPELTAEISPRRRMFFDSKNFLYYWRLSPDGSRVVFGGRTSFAPTTVARSADYLYAAMTRVHPQLAGVAIDYAWGGNVALTFDRMPHLGRHPDTGVVYAMGYCGTGVALATHFGRLIGGWLAGKNSLPAYAARHWTPVPPPARVPRLLPVAGWWYQAKDRIGA